MTEGRERVPVLRALLSLALLVVSLPAAAAEPSNCAAGAVVLWGDGVHDDTVALNAWLRGEAAVWAGSHEQVGAVIAGRAFLLSQAVYAPGGTRRRLEQFRFLWPQRHETVSGDVLATGTDPNAPPSGANIRIVGGDNGEGVAFQAPDPEPRKPADAAKCLTS